MPLGSLLSVTLFLVLFLFQAAIHICPISFRIHLTTLLDFSLSITTLLHLLLPRSIPALFTHSQPIALLAPQCYGLLYSPVTYITTGWLIIGFIFAVERVGEVQKWWRHGLERAPASVGRMDDLLIRMVVAIWLGVQAFSQPDSYFPGSGKVLFSPAQLAVRTWCTTLLSTLVFQSILWILRYFSLREVFKGILVSGARPNW